MTRRAPRGGSRRALRRRGAHMRSRTAEGGRERRPGSAHVNVAALVERGCEKPERPPWRRRTLPFSSSCLLMYSTLLAVGACASGHREGSTVSAPLAAGAARRLWAPRRRAGSHARRSARSSARRTPWASSSSSRSSRTPSRRPPSLAASRACRCGTGRRLQSSRDGRQSVTFEDLLVRSRQSRLSTRVTASACRVSAQLPQSYRLASRRAW